MKNNQPKKTNDRLGSYLTAAVGISTLAGTADAAVVSLDVSSISGPNGNAPEQYYSTVNLSNLGASLTGAFEICNYDWMKGLKPKAGTAIANDGGYATPTIFADGDMIGNDSATTFSKSFTYSLFLHSGHFVSDLGVDSFMGFKSENGHYGYLEVTWDSATKEFNILSGAYESEAGVGILAGATAVPEPASVLTAMSMLASGLLIRRRKQVA